MSALSGIRVVELARILAGPWIGQTLADLGADVVKVESPEGDDTRRWGPPFIDAGGEQAAAYFHGCNRGKRSIVADFSTERGREIVRRLAARSDVLIENFKVGGLKKFGLDCESLRSLNPRLIYCSVTGFGQTGPYAERAGYDFLIQGMSGYMDITGDPDGPPQKVGVAVSDLFTGLHGVIAIEAALIERERTGLGQQIDLALLDTMGAMLANQAMNYLASGVSPRRMGNAHPNIAPYQTFPVSDGWVIVAVGNDGQFGRLCAALGLGCPRPRPALCDQRRAGRTSVGARARTHRENTGLAARRPFGRARARRRARRPDQYGRRPVCRSAIRGARHAHRSGRRARRAQPHPHERQPARARTTRADARRAHGGNSAGDRARMKAGLDGARARAANLRRPTRPP